MRGRHRKHYRFCWCRTREEWIYLAMGAIVLGYLVLAWSVV